MTKTITRTRITFTDISGNQVDAFGEVGESLMQVAKNHDVEGISADCGGAASCGTCQIIVPDAWKAALPEMSMDESDMLEFAGTGEEGGRLSCQIPVTEALDGITVTVASL